MADEVHGEEKHAAAPAGHGGGGHGGGGGHEEAHEGAPEWLISFADNVALLMGFFVILLAMNMGPKASPVQGGVKDSEGGSAAGYDSTMEAIISIREAFHTADFDPGNPNDAKIIKYLEQKKLGNANEQGIPGTNPNVQAIRPSDYKSVTAAIPFDDKSAVLSPSGRQTLSEVAAKLRDQRWVIEIRGHVSPFEEMRDSVKGMRLSVQRAEAVALALVEEGLRWDNLRLVACGSYDRVVGRTYDAQQDRGNQRVEIVVTNETVKADYYSEQVTGGEGKPQEPSDEHK